MTDGQEGETFAQFQTRVKQEFETYVPIPITPEVSCPALPDTCETQDQTDAEQRCLDFLAALSMELTYEDWLAGELKKDCEDLVAALTDGVDSDRIGALQALKDDQLADLFELLGQDGDELADFTARMEAAFQNDADAQNVVDTGVTRPTIPGSCSELTPAIDNANNAFNAWADELQTCSDNDAWLASELATACEVPTGDAQALIDSETGRVQAAKDEQVGVLEALMVFKGIHGETLPQFETRLRSVFDKYVTHRSNAHIDVPTYPDGCTATDPVVAELQDLITEIKDEETFLKWIKANLRACCDDRQDDIEDLIDEHAPSVAGLEARRDELLESLYSFKGTGLTLEEYVAQTDATYGDELAAGNVLEGYSSIMALVPEVPALCTEEDLQNSAVERQQELIIIANAIEALEAQIGWLEPLLEKCCTDLEPSL